MERSLDKVQFQGCLKFDKIFLMDTMIATNVKILSLDSNAWCISFGDAILEQWLLGYLVKPDLNCKVNILLYSSMKYWSTHTIFNLHIKMVKKSILHILFTYLIILYNILILFCINIYRVNIHINILLAMWVISTQYMYIASLLT